MAVYRGFDLGLRFRLNIDYSMTLLMDGRQKPHQKLELIYYMSLEEVQQVWIGLNKDQG